MLKITQKTILLILLLNLFGSSNIKSEQDTQATITPLKMGNLALLTSQQPGPLIGFGQNIVEKGDLQLFSYIDCLKGNKKKFTEMYPYLLYGINDRFSVFVELPIALQFKLNNKKSSGPEDMLVQFEYALYDKNSLTAIDQFTIVANMGLPTGSACKQPSTGYGAPSFFLGFTANHMATDWYYFAASGALLATSHKGTKFGNQFLYQLGLSKNIWYISEKYILSWMVELDGTYKQRDRRAGKINCNSGGNTILLGPSLWFSTQRLIIQGGISWVIAQHLFGCQNKDKYLIAVDIAWKF